MYALARARYAVKAENVLVRHLVATTQGAQ